MHINWEDQLHNLRADPKYSPTQLPVNLLDHCLAIISAVKPIKNEDGLIDSELMLQPLIDNPEGIIHHINGTIINKEYLNMITFLGEINRSKLISNMKNKPRLGSLTPLALYSYKLNNGIPYSMWDKKAKYFNIYLGKFLKPLSIITAVPSLTSEDVSDYRDLMQTVKSTSERKPNNGYRTPLKSIKDIELPSPAVYMLLQLWIANAEHRDTSSMILDPINWDNIPEALDAEITQPVVGKRKVKPDLDPDDWWK